MRRVVPIALAAALACAGPRPPLRASPLVGTPVELVAEDLSGNEVRISQDPTRVRVVDFWATWCEPCRDQLPELDRLARTFGSLGLSVVGVSFDEDRSKLEEFLAELPVSFPILWDRGGARLSGPLDIQRLPTTLLVDRSGIVRHVHLGFRGEEAKALEREIAALLAEPPPPP
jgi:cytochrome c biogenesis protein CcmG, thiol:disulfide interchange protein DsbE